MKKYIIPIFLLATLCLVIGSLIAFGQCTATQSGPVDQQNGGNATVPLHFVYGSGQTADISAIIQLGSRPDYIAFFSSQTCNGLEAQAIAVSSAPGVGNIVPPPPSPSTGVVSVGP